MSTPSSLTLRASRIERTLEAGLIVVDSTADVRDCVLSQTQANASDGQTGDGVVVQSTVNGTATATITRTRLEQTARAGISSFGGTVTLASSDLVCQAFDLDGETFADKPFTWTDDGHNHCGCPNADRACVALSSQLTPPGPVEAPSE